MFKTQKRERKSSKYFHSSRKRPKSNERRGKYTEEMPTNIYIQTERD